MVAIVMIFLIINCTNFMYLLVEPGFLPFFLPLNFKLFKSRLKTSLFRRSFNYSTHNRIPPAPLKLRPYGALQICLLLLFLRSIAVCFPIGCMPRQTHASLSFIRSFVRLRLTCYTFIQTYIRFINR